MSIKINAEEQAGMKAVIESVVTRLAGIVEADVTFPRLKHMENSLLWPAYAIVDIRARDGVLKTESWPELTQKMEFMIKGRAKTKIREAKSPEARAVAETDLQTSLGYLNLVYATATNGAKRFGRNNQLFELATIGRLSLANYEKDSGQQVDKEYWQELKSGELATMTEDYISDHIKLQRQTARH